MEMNSGNELKRSDTRIKERETPNRVKKLTDEVINESEIDEDLLNSSINKSQLKNFIDSLPDKLNTVIGERGIRISGGQKQRIGIARALYHNPHILVFDEATSALDHKTEEQIVNSINELRNTKTIIIISHRQSTLDKCDLIYTFSNKKLIKTSQ